MGLFSGQMRPDFRTEAPAPPELEEERMEEELPPAPVPQPSTVIAKGVVLSGALKGEGTVRIDGIVEGDLELDGSVIVTATGRVKGPVTASVVRVSGLIEGSVTARSHLRLERSGTIQGDVTTSSMVVEDGGLLNGRSTMVKSTPEPIPSAVSGSLPLEDLQFGSNYTPEEGEEDPDRP